MRPSVGEDNKWLVLLLCLHRLVFLFCLLRCLFAVFPAVATNTKPTRLSISGTKLQSSRDLGGGGGVSACDVLRMATNCCAACQRVRSIGEGKVGN